MILTKLRMKDFGKFGEREIDFGKKLNIIYGVNEAGKSTILAFLKAMLYGMNSQKRALRENDRLRFRPWDGEFNSGELHFRDEQGKEMVLRRELGSKRKDNWVILDALTGQPPDRYLHVANPGEGILGLGEAAYSRTVYVPQLGAAVSPDKEDEIMTRLMNLQQTGEEKVSLQKALNNLEKERKSLTLRSGNGKLDGLRNLQADLQNEKIVAENLHEELISEQAELNSLHRKKEEILGALLHLNQQKEYFRKCKQYLEYLELKKEAETISKWQEELAVLDESLLCGSALVDASFVIDCEAKFVSWRQKAALVTGKEEEIREKRQDLAETEERLTLFQGFAGLPEDIDAQLVRQEQKGKRCTESLERINRYHEDLVKLQNSLAELKSGLGVLASFYDLTPAEEKEVANQEVLKRQLEEKIRHDQQIDGLRRDFIVEKMKKTKNGALYGAVLSIAGFLSGFLVHPICYFLTFFGVITVICAYLQRKKNKTILAEIDFQTEDYQSVQNDYHALMGELDRFYARFGASDFQSFAEKRKEFESVDGEIGVLTALITDREGQLTFENEADVRKQLEETHEYISALIAKTDCNSLQELQEKIIAYREKVAKREDEKEELGDLEVKLSKLLTERDEEAFALAELLCCEKSGDGVIDRIEQALNQYKKTLEQKKALTVRLMTSENNLEKRLAGRDLAALAISTEAYFFEEMQSGEFMNPNSKAEELAEEEERNEQKIKELGEERLKVEKQITGLDTDIKNRLCDVRETARIEEELAKVTQQIKHYEDIVEVLDLVRELMEDSFQELQRSFGPVLNSKVGQILQGISAGQYGKVKVAEDYQICLKDRNNAIRDLQFFSNGTLDQVYFALRLGIIEIVYERNYRLPLLLDDAFVQYDYERLTATLNYLIKYAENHQVLLFTCHQREAEILAGRDFRYVEI